MYLSYLMKKGQYAFAATFETFWARPGRKYFWTFTPDGYMGDKEFSTSWHRFMTRLNAWGCEYDWAGLRVFEPFQSGFLHCHAVFDYRFPVRAMRRLAEHTGIGRIHVRRAVATDGSYLEKYIRKENGRLGSGIRQWAKLGDWQHTRVKDVEIISDQAALFRYLYTQTDPSESQGKRWSDTRKRAYEYILQEARS